MSTTLSGWISKRFVTAGGGVGEGDGPVVVWVEGGAIVGADDAGADGPHPSRATAMAAVVIDRRIAAVLLRRAVAVVVQRLRARDA